MTRDVISFLDGPIFDGDTLHPDGVARFREGRFEGVTPKAESEGEIVDLGGDILSPGFVDLQLNGGGGVMFNDDPSPETLSRIAVAHRRLGATTILPTLITDTYDKTCAAIEAGVQAIAEGIPGIAGLHLEGPHLSVGRKGAHDAALIRPMDAADLAMLLDAKARLPVLMVTLAPENVSEAQVTQLAQAGVLVSLGHTDADFDTCLRYVAAGACCATHLFNAMSQLGNREPGLVGAVLHSGKLSAGLIADGVHVHPATMQTAWRAKVGPSQLFLVSDSMAVAGTELNAFELEGRRITRSNGRLELEDGTLAGADLDLCTAVGVLHRDADVPLQDALAAATSVPGQMIGRGGALVPGQTRLSDVVRISADLCGVTALS